VGTVGSRATTGPALSYTSCSTASIFGGRGARGSGEDGKEGEGQGWVKFHPLGVRLWGSSSAWADFVLRYFAPVDKYSGGDRRRAHAGGRRKPTCPGNGNARYDNGIFRPGPASGIARHTQSKSLVDAVPRNDYHRSVEAPALVVISCAVNPPTSALHHLVIARLRE
jgi:hypothetical protein